MVQSDLVYLDSVPAVSMPGYFSHCIAYDHGGGTILYSSVRPGIYEAWWSGHPFDPATYDPAAYISNVPTLSIQKRMHRLRCRRRLRRLCLRCWWLNDRASSGAINCQDASISGDDVDYLSGIFSGIYD